MGDLMFNQWKKERDEAVLSQDYIAFAVFYNKWRRRGVYANPLPDRKVVEASLRYSLLALNSAPVEMKVEARAWLQERGYSDKW